MAQRLVRKVCPDCKTTFVAPPELMAKYGWSDDEHIHLSKGSGCTSCYDSGYKGRMAVHEIVPVDAELQSLMMTNPSRDELNKFIQKANIETLFDDGMGRVREGTTTIEEIQRIISEQ